MVVNAEEEPGTTYEDEIEIEDWSVVVRLMDIAPPVDEVV